MAVSSGIGSCLWAPLAAVNFMTVSFNDFGTKNIVRAGDRYAPLCERGTADMQLAVDRYAPLCERGTADMQLAVDRYAPLCERGTAECAMTRV